MAQITLNSSGVASNGTLALQSNGTTTAVTIDASQNVGIGTASPTVKLDVRGNVLKIYDSGSATANLTVRNSTTGDAAGFTLQQDGVNTLFYNNSNGASVFATNGTERMRIDSSGNLLVGTTSNSDFSSDLRFYAVSSTAFTGAFKMTGGASGVPLNAWNTATSGTIRLVNFYTGAGSEKGSIRSDGSTVSYVTSSDYRLKENVQPMVGALALVSTLSPVTYQWKETGKASQGFIAHELQAVVPECVVGEKDAVDAEGNPQYQGIDTSFLVATLTKAIQEMKAIIDTQASTITQLQADVAALKGTA